VTTYVDSSALVAVYVPERSSEAARVSVRVAGPIPFTPLHRLEMANAFELLVGRRQITRRQCRAIQALLRGDIDEQRFVPVALDLDEVFDAASELSRARTARHLARSLDLLHVAAAHLARCTTFVSADDRQLAVARASGLVGIDIKRRPVARPQ
jgi:predicted nucleic acid-binding protein